MCPLAPKVNTLFHRPRTFSVDLNEINELARTASRPESVPYERGLKARDHAMGSGQEDQAMRCYSDHAQARTIERYGYEPTQADWWQAALDILDTLAGARSAALMLGRWRGTSEVWLVRLGLVAVRLVWVPTAAIVATVLPPRARSRP